MLHHTERKIKKVYTIYLTQVVVMQNDCLLIKIHDQAVEKASKEKHNKMLLKN